MNKPSNWFTVSWNRCTWALSRRTLMKRFVGLIRWFMVVWIFASYQGYPNRQPLDKSYSYFTVVRNYSYTLMWVVSFLLMIDYWSTTGSTVANRSWLSAKVNIQGSDHTHSGVRHTYCGIANFGHTDDGTIFCGSRYHSNISLYQQGLINIFLYV